MNRENLLRIIKLKNKQPDEVECPECLCLVKFYGAFGCKNCGWEGIICETC